MAADTKRPVGPVPSPSTLAVVRLLTQQGLDRQPLFETWGLPWESNVVFGGLAYTLGGRSLYFGGWSPQYLDTEMHLTGCDDLRAMAATTTIRHRQTSRQNHPKIHKSILAAIDHAVRLIHAVCGLAGSATWIDDIRANLRADKVQAAIRHRDTAVVFDWLMAALSYQGIADAVAYDYM